MERGNLCGVWRIIASDKSDHLPGIADYRGSPVVCNLYHDLDSDSNYLKIEKKLVGPTQLIHLLCSYTRPHISNITVKSYHYQLGVLNVEANSPSNNPIILTIVQNCDLEFTCFRLKRIGPGLDATSSESYTMIPQSDELQVIIEICTEHGQQLRLTKYFSRVIDLPYKMPTFKNCASSFGWSLFSRWPSEVLLHTAAVISESVRMMRKTGPGHGSPAALQLRDSIWTRSPSESKQLQSQQQQLDMGLVPLLTNTAGMLGETEEFISFIIQVSFRDAAWTVSHRYRDFESLKSFLEQQQPQQQQDPEQLRSVDMLQIRFPGKSVGLAYRRSKLLKRIESLNAFLLSVLGRSSAYNQCSIDAIASFLMIPEHFSVHKLERKVIEEAVTIDPADDMGELSSRDDCSDQTLRSIPLPLPAKGIEEQHRDHMTEQQWDLLHRLLGTEGILIVKHGRQGSPKSRVLRFSPNGGDAYVSWGDAATKRLFLRDVLSVRKGDDPDPPPMQSGHVGAEKEKGDEGEGGGSCGGLVLGTKNLRRTARLHELSLCMSLILPGRTFDIQCPTQSQCDLLYEALKAACPAVDNRCSNQPTIAECGH